VLAAREHPGTDEYALVRHQLLRTSRIPDQTKPDLCTRIPWRLTREVHVNDVRHQYFL
jgi:hypothetical protein